MYLQRVLRAYRLLVGVFILAILVHCLGTFVTHRGRKFVDLVVTKGVGSDVLCQGSSLYTLGIPALLDYVDKLVEGLGLQPNLEVVCCCFDIVLELVEGGVHLFLAIVLNPSPLLSRYRPESISVRKLL